MLDLETAASYLTALGTHGQRGHSEQCLSQALLACTLHVVLCTARQLSCFPVLATYAALTRAACQASTVAVRSRRAWSMRCVEVTDSLCVL